MSATFGRLASRFTAWRQDRGTVLGRYDVAMFSAAVALLGIGTMLVFSTTSRPGLDPASGADPFMFLKRHVAYLAVGAVAFVAAVHAPSRILAYVSRLLLPVSLVLLVLVLVPGVGVAQLGARRWINILGLTLQPSELAKVGFALYLAHYLARRRTVLNQVVTGLLPLGLMYGLVAVLLVRQPDVGSVVLLGALVVSMLVAGGTRSSYVGAVLAILILALLVVIVIQPEKLARFVGWIFPEATRMGEGYQVYNSQILIGSGGLWGAGLGEGLHHVLGYLPQSSNDFIFSVASEELGFVGVACIVMLYAVIALRGFALARICKDEFSRFAAFALTLLLTLPAVVHMAVDLGLMPTKGLVCPFLSYGGSALAATMGTLGLLQRLHLEATAEAAPASAGADGDEVPGEPAGGEAF